MDLVLFFGGLEPGLGYEGGEVELGETCLKLVTRNEESGAFASRAVIVGELVSGEEISVEENDNDNEVDGVRVVDERPRGEWVVELLLSRCCGLPLPFDLEEGEGESGGSSGSLLTRSAISLFGAGTGGIELLLEAAGLLEDEDELALDDERKESQPKTFDFEPLLPARAPVGEDDAFVCVVSCDI